MHKKQLARWLAWHYPKGRYEVDEQQECPSTSVYYCEHKLKNKIMSLGMRRQSSLLHILQLMTGYTSIKLDFMGGGHWPGPSPPVV